MKKLLFTLILAFFAIAAHAQEDQAQPSNNEEVEMQNGDTINNNIQLSIMATVGASLVRHQIVPMIEATAVLNIRNKNFIYLNNSSYYFFRQNAEGAYRTNINQFASLGYGINTAVIGETPMNLSFAFGYLYHQSGDYFESNTFRFTFDVQTDRSIDYAIDIIVLDGFKSAFPSLRMSVPIGF